MTEVIPAEEDAMFASRNIAIQVSDIRARVDRVHDDSEAVAFVSELIDHRDQTGKRGSDFVAFDSDPFAEGSLVKDKVLLITEIVILGIIGARPTDILAKVIGEATSSEVVFLIGLGSILVNSIQEIDILEKLIQALPSKEIAGTPDILPAKVESLDSFLGLEADHDIDRLPTNLLEIVNVHYTSFVDF